MLHVMELHEFPPTHSIPHRFLSVHAIYVMDAKIIRTCSNWLPYELSQIFHCPEAHAQTEPSKCRSGKWKHTTLTTHVENRNNSNMWPILVFVKYQVKFNKTASSIRNSKLFKNKPMTGFLLLQIWTKLTQGAYFCIQFL